MSYKIYTWKRPYENSYDCGCTSLLLEDTRKAWSMVTLSGEGDHKGTTLTLTKEQLLGHKFDGERELAALLDTLFKLAHARRLDAALTHQTAEERE